MRPAGRAWIAEWRRAITGLKNCLAHWWPDEFGDCRNRRQKRKVLLRRQTEVTVVTAQQAADGLDYQLVVGALRQA